MIKLRVLKEGSEIQNLNLNFEDSAEVRLGRDDACEIRLKNRAVGREHAVISFDSNGASIKKKSKFGKLFINGAESTSASIKAGDVIGIAEYQVHVEDSSDGNALSEAMDSKNDHDLQLDSPLESLEPEPRSKAKEIPASNDQNNAQDNNIELNQAGPDAQDGVAIGLETDLESNENAKAQPPDSPESFQSQSAHEFDAAASDNQNISIDLQPPGAPDTAFKNSEDHQDQIISDDSPQMSSDDSDDDRTSMTSMQNLDAQLFFNSGDANFEQYKIEKSEISIGRGTECDVILSDEKASRKHVVIRRVGAQFMIQDMKSANGTYVNGSKISDQELSSGDVIKIGNTEFNFKAVSQDYIEQEQDFMQVETEQEAPPEDIVVDAPGAAADGLPVPDVLPQNGVQSALAVEGYNVHQETTGNVNTGAIPGLGGLSQSNKKETLLEKFKRQPLPRKIMIVGVIALVLILGLDEEPKKKKPVRNPAGISKQDVQFKSLPKEKKQFVINTYQLAFDLYKNQEFEKALFEIKKVIDILPGGYKDAKDIKIYAEKAIEIKKSKAEASRRKEEKIKLRLEISELTKKAEELVAQERYGEARDLFASVLERDPENPTVLRLMAKIEEQERQRLADKKRAEEREARRQDLLSLVKQGRSFLKNGKYYKVMDVMSDAPAIGSTDKKLLAEAKTLIKKAKYRLKKRTVPHLVEGEAALESGNFPKARDAFYAALKIDYKNKRAKDGLQQVRQILHTRAQRIYTRAIIAESVSDFDTAKTQFKECLGVAMKDDIYFGRCTRKLKRYSITEREVAGERPAPVSTPDGSSINSDPEMPDYGNE